MSELIHPPRGYCIGVFSGPKHGMIGPFATEDEARDALSRAEIVIVGQPAGWHEWCAATTADLVCTKPKGHEHTDDPDPWHDNGSVAWHTDTVSWETEDLGEGRSVSRSYGGCATCDGGGCGDCQ